MTAAYRFRAADRGDLPEIVALLADDFLGRTREQHGDGEEGGIDPAYERAFAEIASDPNNRLLVADAGEGDAARVVAVLQLTFIPSLTYRGGKRAQIEGVRVHEAWKGRGVGTALMRQAIQSAREEDCVLVQLTTDRRREDAHRFYERLGFVTTHWGMKLHLTAR